MKAKRQVAVKIIRLSKKRFWQGLDWSWVIDKLWLGIGWILIAQLVILITQNAFLPSFSVINATNNNHDQKAKKGEAEKEKDKVNDEKPFVYVHGIRLSLNLNEEARTLFTLNYTGVYDVNMRFTASMLETQLNYDSVVFGVQTESGIQYQDYLNEGVLNVKIKNVIWKNGTRIRIGYYSHFVLPSPIIVSCYYSINVTIIASGLQPEDMPGPFAHSRLVRIK